MSTYTDLRIFDGSKEIKLPAGAWRFIQCSINPISEATQTARAIDGSIVNLGDNAFRAYAVEISCTDQRVPPLAGVWPGQLLTIHAPMTLSQPGPATYLEREPVPGSIRAINAAGQVIASPTGRSVNVPGAVAIEYRPVLSCMLISRSGDSTEFKAAAGWSISLEEVGEDYEEETSSFVSLAAFDIPDVAFGGSVSLDLKTLATTEGTVPVSELAWEISGGALPAGVTLSAAGVLSGSPIVPGVYDFTITASAPDASAEQTFVIRAAAPTITLGAQAFDAQESGSAFSFDFKTVLTVGGISVSAVTFSLGSGALPAGLTLSADGVLSGTLTGDTVIYGFEIIASHEFAQARRVYSISAVKGVVGTVSATGGTVVDYNIGPETYRAHIFNASGTLTVSVGGDAEVEVISGAGGGAINGGGGGAGGRLVSKLMLTAGTHSIVVGAGGAAGSNSVSTQRHGRRGSTSSAFGLIPVAGGGGLGATSSTDNAQQNGGSGGGKSFSNSITRGTGTAYQGNNGGTAVSGSSSCGGGGGAGGEGGSSTSTVAGNGGSGVLSNFASGVEVLVAGGGAGNRTSGFESVPAGTANGGGGTEGVAGTANTGGGGGGSETAPGAGGSGRVIIRYRRP